MEDDFNFSSHENNNEDSSIDTGYWRKIQNQDNQINDYFAEHINANLPILKDPPETIIYDERNMESQVQFKPINNNDSSTVNFDVNHMDLDDFNNESQQQMLHANTITDNNNTAQQEHLSQQITTDNIHTNEQQINGSEYLRKVLNLADEWKHILDKLFIPAKTADNYLKSLLTPSSNEVELTSQDQLDKFCDYFEKALHLLASFRPVDSMGNVDHTYSIAKQSNESAETKILTPSEDSTSHVDRAITGPATISKVVDTIALQLSLSKLLSKAETIVQELNFVDLQIDQQPREYWTKRTINCLKNKWTVCIQGRGQQQQQYPSIKWSNKVEYDQKKLFVLIQSLSYYNLPHPSNVIVPAGTTIEEKPKMTTTFSKVKKSNSSTKSKNKSKIRSTLEDLNITNGYEFDKMQRAVLCPVTNEEYIKCEKKIQVIMFNLYETSEEILDTNDDQDSDNDTNDDQYSNNNGKNKYITSELQELSKLRICLCQIRDTGELKCISNTVDTDLIQPCKGSTRVPLTINESKVTPTRLCECGNEVITVIFNKKTDENNINIYLNGIKQAKQYNGITRKQISIKSCPKTISKQEYLHMQISTNNMLKTLKNNFNPYEHIEEDILLDKPIPYVKRNGNPHEHEDVNTEISIESNEISQTQSILK